MTNEQALPQILEVRQLASTSLFEVEALLLRFRNGVERYFERLKTKLGSTVLTIPVLDGGSILLVREYCAGTNTYELSFPTGTIGSNESIEDAAQRELKEEVGLGAGRIAALSTVKSFPGHLDHDTTIVLAADLYPQTLPGDEPEPLEVVRWPVSNLDRLLLTNEFREVRSVAALLLLERFLAGRLVAAFTPTRQAEIATDS